MTKTVNKKNIKKFKTISTILDSIDTFVVIATTSSSIKLSLTGIGLIVIPVSAALASELSNGKEVT